MSNQQIAILIDGGYFRLLIDRFCRKTDRPICTYEKARISDSLIRGNVLRGQNLR